MTAAHGYAAGMLLMRPQWLGRPLAIPGNRPPAARPGGPVSGAPPPPGLRARSTAAAVGDDIAVMRQGGDGGFKAVEQDEAAVRETGDQLVARHRSHQLPSQHPPASQCAAAAPVTNLGNAVSMLRWIWISRTSVLPLRSHAA